MCVAQNDSTSSSKGRAKKKKYIPLGKGHVLYGHCIFETTD